MGRARAMKRVWLFLGIFSAVSAVVTAPLLAVACLNLEYVLAVVLALFCIHGIWGTVFYFLAHSRERATLRVLPYLKRAEPLSDAEIGLFVGMTGDGVAYIIKRARKKGYISPAKK